MSEKQVRVSKDFHKRLKAEAALEGISLGRLVEELVTEGMSKRFKKEEEQCEK